MMTNQYQKENDEAESEMSAAVPLGELELRETEDTAYGKDRRIGNYLELDVYRLAFCLQQRIFEQTKRFPAEERFSLTDQLRRASRSIGENIAEAWQKRRYPAHFSSKLSDADSEQAETQHWLRTAFACHYMDESTTKLLVQQCQQIGGKLERMITNPNQWRHK